MKCILLIAIFWVSLAFAILSPASKYSQEAQDLCFCQLQGHVDDCSCNVNTVDHFNNHKIFPRLRSLLDKDFFRYFEYNPNKKCRFFSDSVVSQDKCVSPRCGVQTCSLEELPPGLKGEKVEKDCDGDEEHNDVVDDSLSDDIKKDIESWKDFDANNDGFCEVDGGNDCKDCVHVDLTKNPERFTGYEGESAHKIWRTIYRENCFRPQESPTKRTAKGKTSNLLKEFFVPQELLGELCLEKRAFYRAVSGLHASITIHLSSRYPTSKSPKVPFAGKGSDAEYGPNLELFLSRFDPELTQNQGPFWLKNLYFVYLLELRALLKAKPFFETQTYYTGNTEDDKDTLIAVKELLNIIQSFPDHFDETLLFNSGSNSQLKVEFKEHFRNISRVMDCVSCDKCKLWGKLQTTGLGTALKILFTNDQLKLSRNEVVALFNAFGRISTSIRQLEIFREMMRKQGGEMFP